MFIFNLAWRYALGSMTFPRLTEHLHLHLDPCGCRIQGLTKSSINWNFARVIQYFSGSDSDWTTGIWRLNAILSCLRYQRARGTAKSTNRKGLSCRGLWDRWLPPLPGEQCLEIIVRSSTNCFKNNVQRPHRKFLLTEACIVSAWK